MHRPDVRSIIQIVYPYSICIRYELYEISMTNQDHWPETCCLIQCLARNRPPGPGPGAGARGPRGPLGGGLCLLRADPGHRLFMCIQVSCYVYNYLGGPGRIWRTWTVSPERLVLGSPSWAQIVDLGEIGGGIYCRGGVNFFYFCSIFYHFRDMGQKRKNVTINSIDRFQCIGDRWSVYRRYLRGWSLQVVQFGGKLQQIYRRLEIGLTIKSEAWCLKMEWTYR